jgi:hypothetical protein
VSTETAPNETVETKAHIANPSGMGGTSAEEGVRADGADETVEGQERPEGAEPEGDAAGTGEEPARREDTRGDRDEHYVSDLEQRVTDADAIARTILADPARLREYEKWTKADQGGGHDDRLSGIDREIEERFPQQADRDAVRSFVGPMAQEIRDLREQMRTLAPRVEQSARIAVSTEVANSLEANGVSRETQRTPEWRKFVARETRDADLKRDLTRRPGYAGKILARSWSARSATQSQRTAENRRTSDLRDGRFHAAASPSRNGAEKVYVVDKTKPGWDVELLNARIAAQSRGEKFKHSYETPKK